jgi:very-short-patch-repair endonuclease
MTRPKGWKPITDSDRTEILRRYAEGETVDALGREFHRAVKPIVRAAGIVRRRGYSTGRVWTPEWRAAHERGTHTDEFRECSRRNLLARLPRMAGPALNSPIERRLHDVLRARGIGFESSSRLLDYLVDIRIYQQPVVIEADGEQHRLPKRRALDERRDADLADLGYRVFRFTGSAINRDANECIQHVVEVCGLTADREPVYNIKTSFRGPDHPLWVGPDVHHICLRCGKDFTTRPWLRGRYCSQECYRTRSRS